VTPTSVSSNGTSAIPNAGLIFEWPVAENQHVPTTWIREGKNDAPTVALNGSQKKPTTAPAIQHTAESEWAVPAGMVQAGADVVRRRWDPIRIGMVSGGLILGAVGVAVAASYSCTHPAGIAVSVIWWGIYYGAFGASIGALPGLFTQRARARTRAKEISRACRARSCSAPLAR
jgi:hypothetical protein